MPRASRAVQVGRKNSNVGQGNVGSLGTRSGGSIRRLVSPVVGQPSTPDSVQTFPIVRKPSYVKAKIRMLIKRNVADGLTGPEADNYTRTSGVVTGDRGGYKGLRILRQRPIVPVSLSGRGNGTKRVIAAPDKTNHAGVRSPYNPTKRAGRSSQGSNKRYG